MFDETLAYLIVLDFEATCDSPERPSPQEIIEFPSVLLTTKTLEVVDTFEAFVRPYHHPVLSPFCRALTGIRQEEVDRGSLFNDVLAEHLAWLNSHGLPLTEDAAGPSYTFVTCGDWDLATMLPAQCHAAVPPIDLVPWPYRRWINIKRVFRAVCGQKPNGMTGMLRALGLDLIGRHHRGIDDCHNIARIVRALLERGGTLERSGER